MSEKRSQKDSPIRLAIPSATAVETPLEAWSHGLDVCTREEKGHTLRVTALTLRIARLMGITGETIKQIQRGALIHDIGRMVLPHEILLKPGALTEVEWTIMRTHPVRAYDLLAPIVQPAGLEIPYLHHERWDGSGYPNGLKRTRIPLAARIFAVADVWDALCSPRPYRPARPEAEALRLIKEQAHVDFDPQVVEAFLAMIEEIRQEIV